ncbi:MAG: CRISPR-associated ring nuclease Crn3/Csx3 [Candidatus Bathyarchaeota archaeon]|nr:CRISPR-associated ring nuclease Crn3/Csx3 [Candidatus Bathyarchaeota archaeon]
MSKIKFNVAEKDEYAIVEFEIDSGVLTPEELRDIKPPKIVGKGVILSGRGPIWLYSYLVHHYHPATFIATYDPRVGAVIVESHMTKYKVGDIIKI